MGLLFSMLDRAKVGKYDLSRRRKSLPPPARHVFNQNTCSFERQRPFLRVSSARGVISCLVGKMQCRASTGQKNRAGLFLICSACGDSLGTQRGQFRQSFRMNRNNIQQINLEFQCVSHIFENLQRYSTNIAGNS